MGWYRPPRQATADFLVSVTDPDQRVAKPGQGRTVPRTSEDFGKYWRGSPEFEALCAEMEALQAVAEDEGEAVRQFEERRKHFRMKHMPHGSPYTVSFTKQVVLCTKRACHLLWNGKAALMTYLIGQTIVALVVGSIFYG